MNVPIFESYSPDCSAGMYELLAPDADTLSTDFQPAYVVNEADGLIQFELADIPEIQTIKASYEYRIRVSDLTESEDIILAYRIGAD